MELLVAGKRFLGPPWQKHDAASLPARIDVDVNLACGREWQAINHHAVDLFL